MGNQYTINEYCGKDPYFEVVHDVVYSDLHFPGCGFLQETCTLYPSCDDVARYNFVSRNCTDEVQTYEFFSNVTKQTAFMETSCLEYFTEAFIRNMEYQGQCCQCNPGWTGIDCEQAVCYPTCHHGTCIEPNVCACDEGWQGLLCHIGICEVCEYGLCIAPEVCHCFYGYSGHGCD